MSAGFVSNAERGVHLFVNQPYKQFGDGVGKAHINRTAILAAYPYLLVMLKEAAYFLNSQVKTALMASAPMLNPSRGALRSIL